MEDEKKPQDVPENGEPAPEHHRRARHRDRRFCLQGTDGQLRQGQQPFARAADIVLFGRGRCSRNCDRMGNKRVKVQTFSGQATLSSASGSWHIVDMNVKKQGEHME